MFLIAEEDEDEEDDDGLVSFSVCLLEASPLSEFVLSAWIPVRADEKRRLLLLSLFDLDLVVVVGNTLCVNNNDDGAGWTERNPETE